MGSLAGDPTGICPSCGQETFGPACRCGWKSAAEHLAEQAKVSLDSLQCAIADLRADITLLKAQHTTAATKLDGQYRHFTQAFDMLAERIAASRLESTVEGSYQTQIDALRRSTQEEFDRYAKHIHAPQAPWRGITAADLDNWFSYHAPTPNQLHHYEYLREAAKAFAQAVRLHTPPGPDQTAAIRKIREAVMTANAAVACHVEAKPAPVQYDSYGTPKTHFPQKIVGSFVGSDPT